MADMNPVTLSGRKALVTGASSGMGRGIALALARSGVDCALIGRDEGRLASTADECRAAGATAFPIACDVGRMEEIESAVQRAVKNLGGLDFLINAAGIHKSGKAQDVNLADWDSMLDVNFRAIYHLTRHALPEIIRSPGGAVISIGSITVAYSGGGMAAASKRALAGFAEALFEDVREHGTKVCTIHPGYVNTPLVRSDRLDRDRMIQPENIAATVLFVLQMPGTACPTEITIRPQRSPYK